MSKEIKKRVNFGEGTQAENTASGPAKASLEVPGEAMPEKAGGEFSASVSMLASTERLLTLRAEDVRAAAARLTEAQEELLRAVGAARDLAKAAAGLTRETQFLPIAAKDNLPPAARAVIFLARILRDIYALSSTTKDTVESQGAAMKELSAMVSEAAQVSTYLTREVAALAEATGTVLPPLGSRNLVEAELQCLTGELKALAELRNAQTATKAGTRDATPQVPLKPQVVN